MIKNTLTVKYKWLLSYCLISLVAIFLCNLSFIVYKNTFKKMLTDMQSDSAVQTARAIDANLNILNQCAQTIVSASLFDSMPDAAPEDIHLYHFRPQVQEINRLAAISGIVDRFYIYFPERSRLLSADSLMSPELAYNTYHAQGNLSAEEWKYMISRQDAFSFYADYAMYRDSIYQPFIFCVRSARTAAGEAYTVVLMSRLSASWAEKHDYITKNNLTIYQSNEDILFKNQGFPVEGFSLTGDPAAYTDRKTGERYIVLIADSRYTSWKYVFFVPYSNYWSQMNALSNIILTTNIVGIVLCFLLAYYLARKNYTPMQAILSLFDKKKGREQNDFAYITSSIQSLIRERDQLETKNENLTQNMVLKRLLTGHIPQNACSESLLTRNHILFDKPYIRVAMFTVSDYSGLFPDNDYVGDQPPIESVLFVIRNVAQDTLLCAYEAYDCSVDKDVYFIIKTDESTDENLKHILKDTRDKLAEYAYIETVVSLSRSHSSAYELSHAHDECMTVLRHQLMFGKTDILSFDDIDALDPRYSYSATDETKITNAITSGDPEQAKQYIDAIFDKNLARCISADAATMLIYDLVTALLRLSEGITLPELRNQLMDNLSDAQTLDASRENIKESAVLLCTYFSDKAASFKISGRIMEIIKDSYQNVNLSVAEIGYKMNKTPQYISRVFKQETGETLSTYIQKYRVAVAKELLLQTNLSVKEIATNVGFTNSNGFIAAFKGLEGVTPGQFKSANK